MKGMSWWALTTGSILLGTLAVPSAWAQQTRPISSQTQPAAPSAPAPPAAFDPSKSDDKAIAIADQATAAMGGDAWAKARFIKFTFDVRKGDKHLGIRTHYWDKMNQRSRMEGSTKEGKPIIVVVDLKSMTGQATVDGQPQADADLKKYTQLAQGNLINDTYWLFTQFKLKDPGVRLRYEGELKAGPITYDKIQLSFDDGTGLTSKDKYWLYVDRANHNIERWSYVLQGSPANASPTAWDWTDWTDVAGMKLATRKTQPGGEVEIVLENVQVFDSLPDTVFTSTAPVDQTAASQPAAGQ